MKIIIGHFGFGCNPKHPLCGALPVPYVPVRVTRGALIPHRYTFVPPRCRTSQYRRTFVPSHYLYGMIWLTPCLMMLDWRVSRAGKMPFCWPSCSLLFCLQLFYLSLLFHYRLAVWGWGRMYKSSCGHLSKRRSNSPRRVLG